MWAGSHGIDVTNNSYFADPWLFNCKNDPEQRAIWRPSSARSSTPSRRARGRRGRRQPGRRPRPPDPGRTSPDDPPSGPVPGHHQRLRRRPGRGRGRGRCHRERQPRLKSFYSSYGRRRQVVAPGGDSILQLTPAAPNGRVLSTWPVADHAPACRHASSMHRSNVLLPAGHVDGLAACRPASRPSSRASIRR